MSDRLLPPPLFRDAAAYIREVVDGRFSRVFGNFERKVALALAVAVAIG